MLLTVPNMIEIIKQAALEAVDASNPSKVFYGKVVSTAPLAINIDQKYTVPKEFLVLTQKVTDYETTISIKEFETEENKEDAKLEKHTHPVNIENKKVTIRNALKVGESVILLQMQGGQRYIVIDKVGG